MEDNKNTDTSSRASKNSHGFFIFLDSVKARSTTEIMTRFARAKGSKADNERRPQEATAWSEVKKQLQVPGGKEQQQGNKKRRHYNPEDEDDDFVTAAINDSGNSAVKAGSGDEAVEEETGEPEPEVGNAIS